MEITVERIREAATKYEELAEIIKKHNRAETEFKICSRGKYKFEKILLIFVVGIMIAFIILVIVCLGALVRSGMLYGFSTESPYFNIMYDNWVGVLPKLCGVATVTSLPIIFPVAILGGIKSAKKGLRIATKRHNDIKVTLDQFIKQNKSIITILPKSYRYPLAANFIAEVLDAGRADTMKEALNLYEEQLHRWRMENKMNKLIEEQKQSFTTIWYI